MKIAWRRNGLFWKFFGLIMVANLLVMTATSYIAIEATEGALSKEHHQQLSLSVAAFIIDRYERQSEGHRQPIRIHHWKRSNNDDVQTNYQFLKQREQRLHKLQGRMEIYNGEGEKIFGQIHRKRDERRHLDYQSPNSGQHYQVSALKPEIPHRIARVLGLIQSVRFILLLITSAVVSFVLSLLITRPLKQLGQHTEQIADGDFQTPLSSQLLKRRDELGDLARQLNAMAEQLHQLINSKQQLLHDVSHELRAPLARLQAAGALIDNGKHAERIEKECQRMNDLVQQILDYARMGELDITKDNLDLSELLKERVQDIQYEYAQHPVQFLQLPEKAPFTGDAAKLHGAIENILRNACKHTAEDTAIDIELFKTQAHWHIRIRDHGNGVTEDELEKLTRPFYRAENRMHGDGFGLGLSIAARAIEQHQGELIISNHPKEEGLVIEITLPQTTTS